jgi:uncharacterized damage-inducible protein DinB
MEIKEIQVLLKTNEEALIKFLTAQNSSFWEKTPEGKWSAGQHVIHLVQSTKPLLNALKLPKIFLKWKFGTSNRPSRTFLETTNRYEEKLTQAKGLVSRFSANMPTTSVSDAQNWLETFSKLNNKLNRKIANLPSKELDTIVLPHPLMGKMTIREILMWNAYHTAHHLHVLENKYL